MSSNGCGMRLYGRMCENGPICVGIDPHQHLLEQWGLGDDAYSIREFSLRIIDALHDRAAAFKAQSAFFERHGSKGVAVLEEIVDLCKQASIPLIMDVKRGDIGSTMAAYADAYVKGPLSGDSFTVSPYLGVESLDQARIYAEKESKGLFVLALTSNPEGSVVQHAHSADDNSVAKNVVETVYRWNSQSEDEIGPHGLVVGATIGKAAVHLDIDLSTFNGIFLSPGFGAQGGNVQDIKDIFGNGISHVLISSSRGILSAGPNKKSLINVYGAVLTEVEKALP
ncbi:MAG: orotidine-5'-phosphate decarboxylase [Actinomycetaceae bacterium]|nr:orotidine-5'-phosphate decarboxylase [Actinomycetaceae bacterium]